MLEEINDCIHKIRKLTKNSKGAHGSSMSLHHRQRSRFLNDYMKQDSRQFKDETHTKPRSKSALRNSNVGLAGSTED